MANDGKTIGLVIAIGGAFVPVAAAKTPGAMHCYRGLCHRVSTVDETAVLVGRRLQIKASYYDHCAVDRSNTCGLTSSGAIFRADLADNAASPVFPDGTIVLAYNRETMKAAVLRINSAGPYRGDRLLDVSRATAEALGFLQRGVAGLEVAVVKPPELAEARYRKMRTYAPVPGYIGSFPSFEAAYNSALVALGPAPEHVEAEALAVAAETARSSELQLVVADAPTTEVPTSLAGGQLASAALAAIDEITEARIAVYAAGSGDISVIPAGQESPISVAPDAVLGEAAVYQPQLETISAVARIDFGENVSELVAILRAKARPRPPLFDPPPLKTSMQAAGARIAGNIRAFAEAARRKARAGSTGRSARAGHYQIEIYFRQPG